MFLFFFLSASFTQAQNCGGSYQCCSGSISLDCSCPRDDFDNCPCTTFQACSGAISSRTCSNSLNCSPYDIANPCDGGAVMEATCYNTGSCGSGSVYCGGSIQGCCPNTQTCNAWLAQGGCGGQATDPDPGGTPSNPPGCTPRSNGWTTNLPQYSFVQNPNGGPNFDATENIYFLRTNNTDGRVTVSWATPENSIDTIEYRFFPWDNTTGTAAADGAGNIQCDHAQASCGTLAGNATSHTFRPRRNEYYRLRVRFRHNCQGVWSAWRNRTVRIDGQVTGRIFVLGPGSTAAQTGAYGECNVTSGTSTAFTSYPGNVTLSGNGYSNTSTLTPDTSRYRAYIRYLNPGPVNVTLNGVPAGYSVACPAGGEYNAGNSTISAPHLTSGWNGEVQPVHFYLCASGATPAAPTMTAPAAAPTRTTPGFASGQYRVWMTFQKAAAATLEFRVIPASIYGTVPEADECSQPGVFCNAGGVGETTFNPSFVPATSDYVIRARTSVDACGTPQTSAWVTRNITVWNSIQGAVYEDLASTCSVSGLSMVPGGTVSVSNTLPYSQTVSNGGVPFNLTVPWGSGAATVTFQNGTQTLCSCPTPVDPAIGCQRFGLSSTENHTAVNFFSTRVSDSWWQVSGGPVLALGTAGQVVRSAIPDSAINPYLIINSSGAAGTTTGFVVTGTGAGSVDLKADPGVQDDFVDEDGLNIIAAALPTRETFDTFVRRYKLPQTRVSDFDGQAGRPSADNATRPSHTPLNGVEAYYHTGNLTVDSNWDVASGETVVVFVDGDVSFGDGATTTVAEGGFLAFIASGNMTFSPEIGSDTASSTTPVIQGLFVADGTLAWPSRAGGGVADRKFVGAGTFVGWTDISLERTFNDGVGGGADNNLYPTTLFQYRPDLLLNAPGLMRVPRYQWQEVAP